MRFRRFDIPAYGPFTDFSIELPAGDSDFHLVYGPNEAGKSSLLRAIRALLFGVPERTTDVFRHDSRSLRILSEIEDADGVSQVFQRRKGRKNTLLDQEGNPLPEVELAGLLGVVDEDYFDSMFGLGSEELRRGADELLRGEGRLGEALFSASMGGTPVDKVIETLEHEAGELYSGRARRSIREALTQHKEALRAKKEALIKPETWDEIVDGLREARDRLDGLTGERGEKAGQKAWLERCRDALPLVGQLTEQRSRLTSLPEQPDLPHSFADEIRGARTAWVDAVGIVERRKEEIERLSQRSEACALQPELLAQEAVIDTLHTGLGAYRENKTALSTKRGEAETKKTQVESACRDLGIAESLDELEPLRITQPQFAEAQETAQALEEAVDGVAATEARIGELEKDLERLRDESDPEDTEALNLLKPLLTQASARESVASQLDKKEATLASRERTVRDLHANLSDAPADWEETRNLQLPSSALIEQFREQFEENQRAAKDLAKKRRDTEKSIRECEAEIERRERQRDLPTVDELKTSRSHRDHGWALVLEDWKGDGAREEFVAGQPLEEAFPEAVSEADSIADRLRDDAEAVAQLEELRTKRKQAQESLEDVKKRVEAVANETSDLEAKWKETCKGCHSDPDSPRVMAEWRETWREFCQTWDQWRDETETLETDCQSVEEVATQLAEALGVEEDDFASLLQQAQDRVEELDAIRIEAATTQRKIEETEAELENLREALPKQRDLLGNAKKAWETCHEALSLDPKPSPSSQVEALRERRELFREYDAWTSLVQESDLLEKRLQEYESDVENLGSKLGLEAAEPEIREQRLWSSLTEAKKEQAAYDDLQESIADLSDEKQAADGEIERLRTAFDALLEKTEVKDEKDLDTFLAHFEDRIAHAEKVDELRESLAGLSRGADVDEFVQEVGEEETSNLDGAISTLAEEIRQLDEQIETARSERQDWETRRRELEAVQDEAARNEQTAEFAVARMRAEADRFVRLQVAIDLLRSQIDTFRQQNQGPFLEKASHWFSEVTGGSFAGIGTSFADGDEPVIAGRRAKAGDGDEVLVSGMSEGTRDQLYLALRLAGLELHLQDHEPMPMILDDLFVHFDDGRATNGLEALAHFAERSQVLLFTHHAHLVELARSHLGEKAFHLVEL